MEFCIEKCTMLILKKMKRETTEGVEIKKALQDSGKKKITTSSGTPETEKATNKERWTEVVRKNRKTAAPNSVKKTESDSACSQVIQRRDSPQKTAS